MKAYRSPAATGLAQDDSGSIGLPPKAVPKIPVESRFSRDYFPTDSISRNEKSHSATESCEAKSINRPRPSKPRAESSPTVTAKGDYGRHEATFLRERRRYELARDMWHTATQKSEAHAFQAWVAAIDVVCAWDRATDALELAFEANAVLNGGGSRCSLTYFAADLGPLGIRQKWSSAINASPYPCTYPTLFDMCPRWVRDDAAIHRHLKTD